MNTTSEFCLNVQAFSVLLGPSKKKLSQFTISRMHNSKGSHSSLEHSFRVPRTLSRATTAPLGRPSSALSQRAVNDREYDENPPLCAYAQQLRKNRGFYTQQRPASAMRLGQPLFETAPQSLDSKAVRRKILESSDRNRNGALTGARLHRHRQALQDQHEEVDLVTSLSEWIPQP